MADSPKLIDSLVSLSSFATEEIHNANRLPEIETRYRALFTVMAEAVLLHDDGGRILQLNPAAESILRGTADMAFACNSELPWSYLKDDGELLPTADLPWMKTVQSGRAVAGFEMAILRSDGSRVRVSANTQPLFPPEEKNRRAVMTLLQELPGQAEAVDDDEPWMGQHQLQSLYESIPNPFFVKDRAGRYLACNSAFESYLGLSRDRILGKTVYEISPNDLADRYTAADQALFENPGNQVYEAKVKWADGSLRDVIFHKTTLTRSDGAVRGLTGLIVDITERKRMELALRVQEQQYRTLVEHSPDLVVRYDSQLRRIYVNPAWEKASGLTAEQVIGVPAKEIPKVSTPVIGGYTTALQQVLHSGERQSVEFTWTNARGEELYLQYVIVPETDQEGRVVSLLSVGRDITESKRTEDALRASETHLRRVNRALRTLSAGNEILVRATSVQELLDRMCRTMVDVGEHVLVTIGAFKPDGVHLESRAWAGPNDVQLRETICNTACRALSDTLEKGESIVIHDVFSDSHCRACEECFRSAGIHSGLILPLQNDGDNLGVLSIFSASTDALDDDEVALMREVSNNLSYGIRAIRDRLNREHWSQRIQATMEETIQALASTVELRDPYTAGHQRRVAYLAKAIGREMGLSENRLTGLYLAAVIHDVGKIQVPAEVLTRPGRLSPIEYEIVKTHVEAGYDILKSIEFPWPIATIVRQHHERMDGSGYPFGLDGSALLLESRILAVADVVEAISSFRPYRPGLGIDHALEEIEAGRGRLFDSDIVNVCLRLIREQGFSVQ
ncbi:MAG: PAS domain S-box protein [Candidatus Thiodiazotropha sp.]